MRKNLRHSDVAALVVQSFTAGYLFQYIVPKFLVTVMGLLFGGRHFDLDALIWIASAVGLFFILRNIWSLYVKIKRSLFPQGDMVAAQKASGH